MMRGVDDQIPSVVYKIEEAAEALSLSERTVRRMIARGELRVHRFGRAVRIPAAEVQAHQHARVVREEASGPKGGFL